MPASSITLWAKTTPDNNDDADGGINWLEGQLPGTVNGSARAMMERLAEYYFDMGGSNTVAGTANAITVTLNDGATAYANGQHFAFKNTVGPNTAAATMNVNAIGVKKIRAQGDTDLAGEEMLDNGIYLLRYDSSYDAAAGAWVLLNPWLPAITNAQALTGSIVGSSLSTYATNADLTTTIPLDDTIPQNAEGTQIFSVAYTARSATNKLRLSFRGPVSAVSSTNIVAAMFKDTAGDAFAAGETTAYAGNSLDQLMCVAEITPGDTSSHNYKVRVGPTSAVTIRMNGSTAARHFGGTMLTTLLIEEIKD